MILKKILPVILIFGFYSQQLCPNQTLLELLTTYVQSSRTFGTEIFCTCIQRNPCGFGMSETRYLITQKYKVYNPTVKIPDTTLYTASCIAKSAAISCFIAEFTTNPTATCTQICPYTAACFAIASNTEFNLALKPIVKDMKKTPTYSLVLGKQDVC